MESICADAVGGRRGACARMALGIVLSWTLAHSAIAASVPWTPSAAGRNAIQVLIDDGGLALTATQWPLPRDAVQQAIDALPADLAPALADARALVQAELRAQKKVRGGTTVRGRRDALAGFGDDATPGSSLQLRSGELDGPHLAMQIGGRLDTVSDDGGHASTARLDDSAVAVDAFGVQAQAWAHRSWWGPGWQSALPLSNNAPPLDGIGFQRAAVVPSKSPWLSWLGPWNMDFFVARTLGEAPGLGSNPLVSGLRLTARPLSNVEIGLTRMVQFGGQGHRETLGSFERAVVGDHQNIQDPQKANMDSGNGLAGYDLRVRCPGGVRCAVYAQAEGEDDRKHLPFEFMEVFGTEAWSVDGVTRMFFELAELGCRDAWNRAPARGCAYRNHAYPGGYTGSDRWLGASAGPDTRLLTLGWVNSEWDSVVRLGFGRVGAHFGTFGAINGSDDEAGDLLTLSVRRGWHFGSTSVTPEFDWNRVATPGGKRVTSRVGLEMSTTLDDLGRASPNAFADALATSSPTTTRLLAGGALIAGAALFDKAANNFAKDHHDEPSMKVLRQVGTALPFAEFGLAGAAWLSREGSRDGNVALASVEAGLTSVALSEALKLAVDRSRPSEDRGATDFGHEKRSDSSFPSLHTALAWSVVTPVAQRCDAPWLYGVAALTNVARVSSRDHWLSDTVAGSVLGYVVGDWFGKRADAAGTSTIVMLVPHGAVMSTKF